MLATLAFTSAAPAMASGPRIYWANSGSGKIGVANLDGSQVNQSFITAVAEVNGVTVDGQRIYWPNPLGNTIGVANLDGTGVNQNYVAGASEPETVAVDAQHVYWTNTTGNSIGMANLDGSGVNQSFITGANVPEGLAVDGQHIYWTNSAGNTVGRANLDGTGVNQSFISGADEPNGVAVDGQHVYWTNALGNTVGRANLDGTGVNQSFISGANVPDGPAVDGGHVYWANFGGNTIGRANLDGSGANQSFITGANSPIGVALDVPVAHASPPPTFPTTPQGTQTAPETVTVSNAGQQQLSVSAVSVSGADPADFLITANTCQSCQLQVAFDPQGQGSRTATLVIASNDDANNPLQLPLAGTGSAPAAPPSPPAPANAFELLKCKTVIEGHGRTHRSVVRCAGKLISGPVGYTAKTNGSVVLSRGHDVYGRGQEVRSGIELALTQPTALAHGAYTLAVHVRAHGHWTTRREQITIT